MVFGVLFGFRRSDFRSSDLFPKLCVIQWAPLNVITDNVIIRLILSDLKRHGQLSIISKKNPVYCDQKSLKFGYCCYQFAIKLVKICAKFHLNASLRLKFFIAFNKKISDCSDFLVNLIEVIEEVLLGVKLKYHPYLFPNN